MTCISIIFLSCVDFFFRLFPSSNGSLDLFGGSAYGNQDPGHHILNKLIGETLAKDLLGSFLFNGVDELGSKTFLDYFPEYRDKNGAVIEKRSVIGKSFELRPWNSRGEFIGNDIR